MCISERMVIAAHFSIADRCVQALSDVGEYKHFPFYCMMDLGGFKILLFTIYNYNLQFLPPNDTTFTMYVWKTKVKFRQSVHNNNLKSEKFRGHYMCDC